MAVGEKKVVKPRLSLLVQKTTKFSEATPRKTLYCRDESCIRFLDGIQQVDFSVIAAKLVRLGKGLA